MICRKPSLEEQSLDHLIGPKIKSIALEEMTLYNEALRCKVFLIEKKLYHVQENYETVSEIFTPLSSFPNIVFRQSYRQWKAGMDMALKLREIKKKKSIYIFPLEEFPGFISGFNVGETSGFMELLKKVCEIFFWGFEIQISSSLLLDKTGWNITSRVHPKTKQKQFLVSDIQKQMKKVLPKDGYCGVGVTWTDLYPREGVSFCLGEAHPGYSSGVFCFGRFQSIPTPEDQSHAPELFTEVDGHLLWRMMKVVTHETCHILGMGHCFFFQCAMNESFSVKEAMEQPFFLCPVCLRKLQKMCKFTLKDRYDQLLVLFKSLAREFPCAHFTQAIVWLEKVIQLLETNQPAVLV